MSPIEKKPVSRTYWHRLDEQWLDEGVHFVAEQQGRAEPGEGEAERGVVPRASVERCTSRGFCGGRPKKDGLQSRNEY